LFFVRGVVAFRLLVEEAGVPVTVRRECQLLEAFALRITSASCWSGIEEEVGGTSGESDILVSVAVKKTMVTEKISILDD
jgi:hypothetical protein